MTKKYISYHLFGDRWDDWFNTRKDADKVYKQKVQESEGNINMRLYRDESFEDELEVEEIYIKGRGDFPW